MKTEKHTIVVFGATGDLMKKKILPAIYRLHAQKKLGKIPVLCIGRKNLSREQYFSLMGIKKKERGFLKHIHYASLDLSKKSSPELKKIWKKLDKEHQCKGNVIFYLALASRLFEPTVKLVKNSGLLEGRGEKKVAFEKPFGTSLRTATKINKCIAKVFKENQTYRVDHYLGKELVENLVSFRFANSIFENVWNNKFIDNVQMILSEDMGIEGRSSYYDNAGATRDIIQNHILQVLSLVGMEAPRSLDADDIRDQKVKVLKALKKVSAKDLVLGQYEGYKKEKGIPKGSRTETFVALKTEIKNKRWRGVPFYIKTGKRLDKKYTEVNLILKDIVCNFFCDERKVKGPNVISIRINPDAGLALGFNAKVPETKTKLKEVSMEFCHGCEFGPNTPQAYENLLKEMMRGDQTLFARWDEVKGSWKFTDKVLRVAKKKKVPLYKSGSLGPKEADTLLKKDGRGWITMKRRLKG